MEQAQVTKLRGEMVVGDRLKLTSRDTETIVRVESITKVTKIDCAVFIRIDRIEPEEEPQKGDGRSRDNYGG